MSCNSAIYTVNATNAAVTTTAGTFVQVPFGSVIRRFGRALRLDGGSILAAGSGYFDVAASITLTPTAAGPITVQMRQDGTAVPGLTATVTGAASSPITLPLNGLARNCGCDCNSTLTLWVDAPCELTNCSVVVEKI